MTAAAELVSVQQRRGKPVFVALGVTVDAEGNFHAEAVHAREPVTGVIDCDYHPPSGEPERVSVEAANELPVTNTVILPQSEQPSILLYRRETL